jgi:flagellar secretion chaperone FliS
MNPAARDEYLTTTVLTAAPQKLQLLLIEAAIRFGRQAELHWQRSENEAAFNAVVRCQEIVTQLIAGLAENLESPLVRQISAIYAFIYRALVSAAFHHDAEKLAEALRVLEIERETWQHVCERLGTRHSEASAATNSAAQANAPLVIASLPAGNGSYNSFSFEA